MRREKERDEEEKGEEEEDRSRRREPNIYTKKWGIEQVQRAPWENQIQKMDQNELERRLSTSDENHSSKGGREWSQVRSWTWRSVESEAARKNERLVPLLELVEERQAWLC